MKQTLLLESVMGETRLAVIEEDRLCELYLDCPGQSPAAGSIFAGRVENVLPGMNAAFVDLGLEKNGFMYAGDLPGGSRDAKIGKLVRPGQALVVQIDKPQSGQKGHRLTGRLTLPGRLMALTPGQGTVGVSKKLQDDAERERLRTIGVELARGTDMGVIIRTAACGAEAEQLAAEYRALTDQWTDIERRAACALPPALIYDNGSLPLRLARDMLNPDVEAVWVDGEELYRETRRVAGILAPDLVDRIKLHEGQTPLFDLHRVDSQMDKALRKYVWLKSGGSLVIEATEAMTVIDVNTGKFTGSGDLEETLFRLNCEAAEEIARQLRLRDVGGIVVVDFIDMQRPGNDDRLLEHLKALAARDRNRLTVVGMTGLGLVELTRKRERQSLSKQLLHTCSACGGDGTVPAYETTARAIERDLWRRRRMGSESPLLVKAYPKVTGWLRTLGKPAGGAVYAVPDAGMAPEAYDISPTDLSDLPEKSIALK